jgi:hypothetical protein
MALWLGWRHRRYSLLAAGVIAAFATTRLHLSNIDYLLPAVRHRPAG